MEHINDPDVLKLIILLVCFLLSLLISVIGVIAKWAISSALVKMDEFLAEVRKLTNVTIELKSDVEDLKEAGKDHHRRLNEHGSKIQTLDVKIVGCQSKNSHHVTT